MDNATISKMMACRWNQKWMPHVMEVVLQYQGILQQEEKAQKEAAEKEKAQKDAQDAIVGDSASQQQ